MAESVNTAPVRGMRWAAFLAPDAETLRRLLHARPETTKLTECGRDWDAVVIAPLSRGLAALDVLGLPLERGYPVIADHSRHELIVQVPVGTAWRAEGVQGVRALSRESWILIPAGPTGSYVATWLSRPSPCAPYVDPEGLREALLAVDERR